MKTASRRWLIALTLLLALGTAGVLLNTQSGSAKRQEHPRVADTASLLEPFGPRLGRMADAFRQDLGVEVLIVTQDHAEGTIEAQANTLFEARRIGATAPTGGLLVILNPTLQQARIEVGYTLEGVLTDLHMGRIARDQLAPYVSYGAAGMAVMDVLHQLRDLLSLAAVRGELSLDQRFLASADLDEYRRFVSGGAGARTALSDMPADADLKRTLSPAERARYQPAAEPAGSVESFLRATADLAGDPSLELFTAGSRLMRAHYPLAPLEELQRHERILASMPLEYRIDGDYAVATSRRPAHGFVPILLRRERGLWRVDLVETWKNLFFDREGNYYLKNASTPYAFGLAEFGKGRRYDIGEIALERTTTPGALETLQARTGVTAALRRAELWLRNAFVFPRAYADYQAALALAPEDPLVLQVLGERALYLGFPEVAIPALEQVGRGLELVLAEAHEAAGDMPAASRWVERALGENPYDLHALSWRRYLAERTGNAAQEREASQEIKRLSDDVTRPFRPVELTFEPHTPRFDSTTTHLAGDTTVYDHSEFSVSMRNTSSREVEIEKVRLRSYGTGHSSGLGDIRDYWQYPAGDRVLRPGESVRFNKHWGFTRDTEHEHVRYVFHLCWRGVDEGERQCRTQWVDALPAMSP